MSESKRKQALGVTPDPARRIAERRADTAAKSSRRRVLVPKPFIVSSRTFQLMREAAGLALYERVKGTLSVVRDPATHAMVRSYLERQKAVAEEQALIVEQLAAQREDVTP